MSRWFSLGLAAALAGTAAAPAHAAWLRDELRNYRSFPRLNEAFRLYQNKDYAKARPAQVLGLDGEQAPSHLDGS